MLGKAEAKYIRISASKARLLVNLVKGKTVEEANFILMESNKNTGKPLFKVINSALANANKRREEKLLEKDVIISKISSNQGPYFMRFRAATMGRATPIRHRTTHVLVEIDERPQAKDETALKKKARKKKNGTKSSSN